MDHLPPEPSRASNAPKLDNPWPRTVIILAVIFGTWLLWMVVSACPSMDCSSPESYAESAKEVLTYIAEEKLAPLEEKKWTNGNHSSIEDLQVKEACRQLNLKLAIGSLSTRNEIDGKSAEELFDECFAEVKRKW